jgi:hypothetical protein
MEKKNVESFLDLLDAQIFCFQGRVLYPLYAQANNQSTRPLALNSRNQWPALGYMMDSGLFHVPKLVIREYALMSIPDFVYQ